MPINLDCAERRDGGTSKPNHRMGSLGSIFGLSFTSSSVLVGFSSSLASSQSGSVGTDSDSVSRLLYSPEFRQHVTTKFSSPSPFSTMVLSLIRLGQVQVQCIAYIFREACIRSS